MTQPQLILAIVIGTRPEAIKMAPVYLAARQKPGVRALLVSTGQHRELVHRALEPFGLKPDLDLEVMSAGQTPNDVLSRVLSRFAVLLGNEKPDAVIVQGDTTTTLAAALCAYHLRIPVGHVEAGLRTYDHDNPFPEEANRQMVSRIATWSFAPTEMAKENLERERIEPGRIFVTGNTAVDAVLRVLAVAPTPSVKGPFVLMTLHRRESFGEPLREILRGVRDFLEATPQANIVWPVHPNPNVIAAAQEVLGGDDRLQRMEPIPYDIFAGYLRACRFVITDSGGIQEEGPSLGKTVLIARETTERPEALAGGLNRLMGRKREEILTAIQKAWADPPYGGDLPAPNPYGDGHASDRIVDLVLAALRAK